jgi:hypothetical protein
VVSIIVVGWVQAGLLHAFVAGVDWVMAAGQCWW